MLRRLFWIAACLSLISLVLVGCGGKQNEELKYPTKPVSMIVPFEAGSGSDIVARQLNELAAKKLGQPVVVVNKPGAAGSIGLQEIYNAKPDGYTIGTIPNNIVTCKLQGLLPYNHHDYKVLGIYQYDAAAVYVSSKRPWKTLKEVVDYARAHPGELKIATSSKGAIWHLATVAFADAVGAKFDILPQAGAASQAVVMAAGGHVDLAICGPPEAKSQVDAGNVKMLAVMAPERLKTYPDVPTLKELGYDVTVRTVRSVIGPKGMPEAVVKKLVEVYKEAAQSEEFKKFLDSMGSYSLYLPPQEAVKFYDEEEKFFAKLLDRIAMLGKSK